jgi:hypothetical protein
MTGRSFNRLAAGEWPMEPVAGAARVLGGNGDGIFSAPAAYPRSAPMLPVSSPSLTDDRS